MSKVGQRVIIPAYIRGRYNADTYAEIAKLDPMRIGEVTYFPVQLVSERHGTPRSAHPIWIAEEELDVKRVHQSCRSCTCNWPNQTELEEEFDEDEEMEGP